MALTNEEYIDRLNQCLKKKIVLLNEILIVSVEQKTEIENENYDKLNEMIGQKQKYIDDIDIIDNEFEVYFKRLKTNLNVTSLDLLTVKELNGAADLKENVSEVFSILKKIQECEKENQELANAEFNEVKENINRIKVGKKANSAYFGKNNFETQSYFIDSKK